MQNVRVLHKMAAYGYVLAMVGYLKNVSPTFAQMPNRIATVEFTTVSPTIANTMLVAVFLSFGSLANGGNLDKLSLSKVPVKVVRVH
jgi:hypothetical protein